MRKILTHDQKLRVFVSSTIKELAQGRRALKKAIKEDLKLHPIMFEEGASPHPPRDKYRAWLEQSHIFVGVLWESYGWIAPGMDISGIEDEYNIAKKLAIPRLVYLKNTSKGREKKLVGFIKNIEKEAKICFKKFDDYKELVDLVKSDIALLLTERFDIAESSLIPLVPENYLKRIQEEMAKFKYIERPRMLSSIEKTIESEHKILLIGEPGSGKTFLLGKLGIKKSGIYISIRDKSPLEVYSYLTNKLRIETGKALEKFTIKEDAKLDLEIALQNSKKNILIDEIDQNIALARSLIGLYYYQNKVIFAARSDEVLGGYAIKKVLVKSFSKEEVKSYLEQHNKKLTPSKFLELFRACHGNPLYLYYLTNFQIEPFPDGLEAYQSALWRELDSIQNELLGFVALSLFPLKINMLRDAYNKLNNCHKSSMEINSVLKNISSIIRVENGYYDVFHPYFKEAVVNELDSLGISHEFHKVLGEVKLKNDRIVDSTYHFKRSNDKRAKDRLLEAAYIAFLKGLWDIAEEFLLYQINISKIEKDFWTEGYSRYHFSFLLLEKGLIDKANLQLQKAMEAFENCNNQTWINFVEIQQYLNVISEGKSIVAIDALNKKLDIFKGVDPRGEAGILVNLSFAYIQISQFREGAEAAKSAYEIFIKEKDYDGITACLVNLTSCLAQLDEYGLTRKYSEEIIKLAKEQSHTRLKAAGLNILAISMRKQGDPEGARKCLEEAIDICQQLGLVRTEITNILNLGNTFKDQNNKIDAYKCYQEGLSKAKENNFMREEGRAFELIASLKKQEEAYLEAIDLYANAIKIYKKTGDSLRTAESITEKAECYAALNINKEAAHHYEEAAIHYESASKLNDVITSFERAGSHWAMLGNEHKTLSTLNKAVELALNGDKVDLAISSIENIQAKGKIKELDSFYLKVIEQFVNSPSKANLSLSLFSFASYCKLSEKRETKTSYFKVLKILADNVFIHKNICTSLIVGIEQADEKLLTIEEFENVVNQLINKLDNFYFRKMPDAISVWTAVWRLDKLITFQIQCLSEQLTEKRLSLILMLILLAHKDTLIQRIKKLSGLKETSITFMVIGQDEFEIKVQKLPDDCLIAERPVLFSSSNVPFTKEQSPTAIIVHSSYSTVADWSIYPENKALIWLIMNFYKALIEHFSHRIDEKSNAKMAREFCEEIFGYKETAADDLKSIKSLIKIKDIKSALRNIKRNNIKNNS